MLQPMVVGMSLNKKGKRCLPVKADEPSGCFGRCWSDPPKLKQPSLSYQGYACVLASVYAGPQALLPSDILPSVRIDVGEGKTQGEWFYWRLSPFRAKARSFLCRLARQRLELGIP